MSDPFPQMKQDAWQVYSDAMFEHDPSHVFALFSGGNDSTVLAHWAKQLGGRLNGVVFIDTGTALPGVREFVENFCGNYELPLLVYEAPAGEYAAMVADHGFPGPASHRYAYVRLKERQLDALIREHKTGPRDRVMLLTGVRRAESRVRMGRVEPVRRDGATVWVAPLIDWTDGDMRAYRADHNLPQSDVAALMHRSGECNCGAFAAPGERDMMRDLFPEWFDRVLAPLEAACGARWGERRDGPPALAGPLCSDCQLWEAA